MKEPLCKSTFCWLGGEKCVYWPRALTLYRFTDLYTLSIWGKKFKDFKTDLFSYCTPISVFQEVSGIAIKTFYLFSLRTGQSGLGARFFPPSLVGHFEDVRLCAVHARHTTVMPQDRYTLHWTDFAAK